MSMGDMRRASGDLFGIAASQNGKALWLTDDGTNTLDLYH